MERGLRVVPQCIAISTHHAITVNAKATNTKMHAHMRPKNNVRRVPIRCER